MITVTPNIMVRDVNAVVEYCRKKFGFKFVMGVDQSKKTRIAEFENCALIWAIIRTDNLKIMFQKDDSLCKAIPESII